MTRKLLFACCVPLLVTGCARGMIVTPRGSSDQGAAFVVERMQDYAKPRNVPARFQHLVDWHTGTAPVVLLITHGGQLACAVTPDEATRAIVGQPFRCRWSGAR